MRLLVTGASGFIGRSLVRAVPKEWHVTATYHRSEDFPAFVESLKNPRIKALRIDLADAAFHERATLDESSFDACVFLAANGDPAVSVTNPALDLCWNTLGLVRLVEKVNFRRFIFFSSGAVYDGIVGPVTPAAPVHPTLPYAISKLASEQYLHHFQKAGRIGDLFVIRFFGAYGPGEPDRKIYGKLVRRFAMERDPRFTIRGDGRNLIDAMYIDDGIRAILHLLNTSESGSVLDCSSGQPRSLYDLVTPAAEVFGLRAEVRLEGSVPEYIEFRSVDESLSARYKFAPAIGLQEGLRRFADFLKSSAPA